MFVAGSLWLAALAALPPRAYPLTLAFAGALARAATLPLAFAYPYAPGGNETPAFATRPGVVPVVAVLAILTLAAYALAPPLGLLVPGALLAGRLMAGWIAARLGGGLVGDAYGFEIVILEIACVVAVAAGTAARGE